MCSAVFRKDTLANSFSSSQQYRSSLSYSSLVLPSLSKISTGSTRAEEMFQSSSVSIISSLIYLSISAALGPIGLNNPFSPFSYFKTNSYSILRYYLHERRLVFIPLGIFLSLFALLMYISAARNTFVCPGYGSVNISSTKSKNRNQKMSSLSSVQRYLNFLDVSLT